jgi:hypothetical protein
MGGGGGSPVVASMPVLAGCSRVVVSPVLVLVLVLASPLVPETSSVPEPSVRAPESSLAVDDPLELVELVTVVVASAAPLLLADAEVAAS